VLYRVLENLATTPETRAGTISTLSDLSERSRAILLERGRIAVLPPVPLAVFGDEWVKRGAALGIDNAVDLLTDERAGEWHDELKRLLSL